MNGKVRTLHPVLFLYNNTGKVHTLLRVTQYVPGVCLPTNNQPAHFLGLLAGGATAPGLRSTSKFFFSLSLPYVKTSQETERNSRNRRNRRKSEEERGSGGKL